MLLLLLLLLLLELLYLILNFDVVRLIIWMLSNFLGGVVRDLLRVSLCVVLMRPLDVEITNKEGKSYSLQAEIGDLR